MGIFHKDEKTRGHTLISNELATARMNLKDREGDLEKAILHVSELREIVGGLIDKVSNLEHDQRALDRGYIALMGDRHQQSAQEK